MLIFRKIGIYLHKIPENLGVNFSKMRYLEKYIVEDLQDGKMVFVGWPRQVGKTTLALQIAKKYFPKFTYLNRDNLEHRKRIIKGEYDFGSELIILDEIHKFSKWKSFLKGEYDVKKDRYKFLITGSARLDVYQKWGDSMLGRYFHYRLHPFSLAELLKLDNDFSKWLQLQFNDVWAVDELEQLIRFWSFPEVLFKRDIRFLNRWKANRLKRVVYEDIRDLNNIKNLSLLEVLASVLPTKVGSLFSMRSLSEDLQVSNKTIASRIEIFERVYLAYRIYPFYKSDLKSLKKEPKLYLRDYTYVKDKWAKYENLIANHLLKWIHFLQDVWGYDVKLHFLRDKEKREVDFVITYEGEVKYLVEVKTKDTNLSKHLLYYYKRFPDSQAFQVVFDSEPMDVEREGIRIISASKFLTSLV